MERLKLSFSRQTLILLGVLLIAVAILATLTLALQQQDIRNRAVGECGPNDEVDTQFQQCQNSNGCTGWQYVTSHVCSVDNELDPSDPDYECFAWHCELTDCDGPFTNCPSPTCNGSISYPGGNTCTTTYPNHSLSMSWNVQPPPEGTCNIYIQGQSSSEQISNNCSGSRTITSFNGAPLTNDGTFELFVSNGQDACTNQSRGRITIPCASTPPACNTSQVSLSILPASAAVGANINFKITGDASTEFGDDFQGAVENCTGNWAVGGPGLTCKAKTVGSSLKWTHTWKNCVGANCSIACTKDAPFAITGTAATLTASPNPVTGAGHPCADKPADNCGDTTISWNTGSSNGLLKVSVNGGAETVVKQGVVVDSAVASWIGTGQSYLFKLYLVSSPQTAIAQVTVTRPGTTTATLTASPNPIPGAGGPCPDKPAENCASTTIAWNTGDGSGGKVYVSIDGGADTGPLWQNPSGSEVAPWIKAGSSYIFKLYAGTALLKSVSVTRSGTTVTGPGGLSLSLALEGFPGIASTPAKDRDKESVRVTFRSAANVDTTFDGQLTYSAIGSRFEGTVSLGSTPTGTYTVLIKPTSYLIRNIGNVAITSGSITPVSAASIGTFLACDLVNNNEVDALDLNQIITNIVFKRRSERNTPGPANIADITRDGVVDIFDYNLCVQNFTVKGDRLP